MEKEKKKHGFLRFLLKFFIYTVILLALLLIVAWGTKYYFYDSDYSVKSTDLSEISVDGIRLGMGLSEVNTDKYKKIDETVEDCNFNFEDISFRTNNQGVIDYIVADGHMLKIGSGDNPLVITKANELFDELGKNYKSQMYEPDVDNYWKIAKYSDTGNDIYLGIIYSRFNDEIDKVILSTKRLN